jgi:hypothetical protein
MIPPTMSLRPMTTSHSFMTQVDKPHYTHRRCQTRHDYNDISYFFLLRMNTERTSTEFRKTPQSRGGRVARGPLVYSLFPLLYCFWLKEPGAFA